MRSTFKVLFYVKKGSEKPNGNLPLMCRITVDGEIKQFSCKMDVPPRLWEVKNSRASGKSVEAQKINLAVDKIRVEVNRRYQEQMQTDGYVTAAKLKDAYLGIGVKQETLLKLFEQHNAEFEKKVGHSRAQGTFTRYRTVCNHIREFLPHTYKREDIPLKELNLTFINDFEYFLRTVKKCRTNTVWGYMIVLKHIVSIARNDGRLPFNPFAGYINPKTFVTGIRRGVVCRAGPDEETLMSAGAHELSAADCCAASFPPELLSCSLPPSKFLLEGVQGRVLFSKSVVPRFIRLHNERLHRRGSEGKAQRLLGRRFFLWKDSLPFLL